MLGRNPQALFRVYLLFAVSLGMTVLAWRLAQNLMEPAPMHAGLWGAGALAAFVGLVLGRKKRGLGAALLGVFAICLGFLLATLKGSDLVASILSLRGGVALTMMIVGSVIAYAKNLPRAKVSAFLRVSGGTFIVLILASQVVPDVLLVPAAIAFILYFTAIHVRETGLVLTTYKPDELPLPAAYMLAFFLVWTVFAA